MPHAEAAVACLWVLTPLAATLALVVVCVAVTTNQWLLTEEKMTNPHYNGTGDRDYLSKHTVSGLWTLCYTNPGEREMHCFNIDYFPKEEYSPDPNDSTMAIPYAVTRSAAFFLAAAALLLLAEVCVLAGHCARHRRLCTFVSGVICIVAGLLMLIGLVMYISIFKAEIGSKLRPRSQLQPPLFTYRYGFSFLLVVSGFMASETAGTCAVFLYIFWHQLEWGRKRHDLHRKLSASSALLSPPPPACRRHHLPPPPPVIPHRRYMLESGRGLGGGSTSRLPPPEDHCRSPPPPPPCLSRSHQDLRSAGGCFHAPVPAPAPPYHRHLYHHHTLPPPPPHYHRYHAHVDDDCGPTPPPPPTLHHHGHHHHHHHHHHQRELSTSSRSSSFFPRDATTNTVSTTADINSCAGDEDDAEGSGTPGVVCAAAGPNGVSTDDDDDDEYSPSLQHEFVTFDLDDTQPQLQPAPQRVMVDEQQQTTVSALRPRGDFAFDTLRRTTPV
ncbi:uncharacterized protein LOC126335926 [Schistocerca gregaria]|uniref:uncharacterized protein LOC126335926 n=1 Tax=Schistocerca gregaria TaxID=7010 RepID=UPI00211EA369|nr:uncharacterized protein LOC126335926 [Schistocerca gregaria]